MDVRFHAEGIHLPALDLWLDPEGDRPTAFLSHAHADHARGAYGETFCSPATGDLYRLRGGAATNLRCLAWGVAFPHRDAQLTLFPAGHILGAAQLLVEHGGERLVYTGDFKLDPPLLADQGVVVPCDHLIIESTFGLPIFRFLSASEARARLVALARAALESRKTPVFLGYPLGRGQEIVDALSSAGVPVSLHGAVAKYVEIYRRYTGRAFDYQPYERGVKGHAIVGPSSFGRALGAERDDHQVIAVGGWALLDSARARYGAEKLVPYSDHAGFDELVRCVEESGARRVDVVHGYAEAFAAILRGRGVDARAPAAATRVIDDEEAGV